MASPLKPGKQAVNLAAPGVRVSRIRRDPPPVVKLVSIRERNERDARLAVIGIIVCAIIVFGVVLLLSDFAGWSPGQYKIRIHNL